MGVVPLMLWDNANGDAYKTRFSNCGALERIFFYRDSAYAPVEIPTLVYAASITKKRLGEAATFIGISSMAHP